MGRYRDRVHIADARRRAEQLKHLNAFISMAPAGGGGRAGGADAGNEATNEERDAPVLAVKDLIDVAGLPTTGGGILLPPEPAAADAPVVARLRAAGYVVIGKTNLHEWAWGITSLNPHFGPVRNPRDPDRIAGGSSGGSAVAVAAGMADLALGTDTGGSIRIPAALCGVAGFKPTLGSVPIDGVIPLSPSLDTVGPLAPTVDACAAAFALLTEKAGAMADEPATAAPRLAVPDGWVDESQLDETVAAAWLRVADGLPRVPFPDRVALARAADTVLPFEALAYHRRWFESTPERYGDDLRARLTNAYRVTEADYRTALDELGRLREEADRAMEGFDALLVPTVPIVAPTIADATSHDFRHQLTMFTRPFNATGQPVVALPLPVAGLPVGVQVVGRAGEDRRMLRAAALLEASWQRLDEPA